MLIADIKRIINIDLIMKSSANVSGNTTITTYNRFSSVGYEIPGFYTGCEIYAVHLPSHCATFIRGNGIHSEKFPCPHLWSLT